MRGTDPKEEQQQNNNNNNFFLKKRGTWGPCGLVGQSACLAVKKEVLFESDSGVQSLKLLIAKLSLGIRVPV